MRQTLARYVLVIIASVLVVFLAGEITIGIISYSTAKDFAEKVSLSGAAYRFSESYFNQIKMQAFWLIPSLAVMGALLFFFWKKIELWIINYLPGRESVQVLREIIKLNRYEVVGLLLITGLGLVFRVVRMQEILKFDELHNFLQYAQNPLLAVTAYISDANNHIFHSFLISLITNIFGDSYWAIRSVAFISGILLIPLVFFAARFSGACATRSSGWVAATIVSAYPLCCAYSANARGYTLQMVLGLLTWILFDRIYNGNREFLLAISSLCALAMWTIATSFYLFIGLILAFVGGIIQNKIKGKDFHFFFISTCILSLFLWGPIIEVSGIKPIIYSPDALPVSVGAAIDPFWLRFRNITDVISLSLNSWGLFLFPFLIVCGVFVVNRGWQRIGGGLFLSALIVTAILQVTPHTRVWLFWIPLFAIFIDRGIMFLLTVPIKSLSKYARFLIGGLCLIYVVIVWPQIFDYGTTHKDIAAFTKIVAKQWSENQNAVIQIEKKNLEENEAGHLSNKNLYSTYSVRYYLKRAGIPDSAFKWRKNTTQPRKVWLILIQENDFQKILGKTINWDIVMEPLFLAKNVPINN